MISLRRLQRATTTATKLPQALKLESIPEDSPNVSHLAGHPIGLFLLNFDLTAKAARSSFQNIEFTLEFFLHFYNH